MRKYKEINVNVWNVMASVNIVTREGLITDSDIEEYLDEKTIARIQKYAEDSVYRAGGALNISAVYPPSPRLLRYLSTKKVMNAIEKAYYYKLLPRKVQDLKTNIEKLREKLKVAKDAEWRIKKAVRTWINASKRDKEFVEFLKNTEWWNVSGMWPCSEKAREEAELLDKKFPEYVDVSIEKNKEVKVKKKEIAQLLIEGYTIVETDDRMPTYFFVR